MARLILFVILIAVLYAILKSVFRALTTPANKSDLRNEPEELVKDPYCGTYLPRRFAIKRNIRGTDHYFCSRQCLESYIKNRS